MQFCSSIFIRDSSLVLSAISFYTLQVILGRATIDSEVDINLGEEGRANKVSRRQVGFVLAFLMQPFAYLCVLMVGKSFLTSKLFVNPTYT